jgi:hypothetical protein
LLEKSGHTAQCLPYSGLNQVLRESRCRKSQGRIRSEKSIG